MKRKENTEHFWGGILDVFSVEWRFFAARNYKKTFTLCHWLADHRPKIRRRAHLSVRLFLARVQVQSPARRFLLSSPRSSFLVLIFDYKRHRIFRCLPSSTGDGGRFIDCARRQLNLDPRRGGYPLRVLL